MKLLPRKSPSLVGSLLILWSVLLVTGAFAIWRYSAVPGSAGESPSSWPSSLPFKQGNDRAALIMLVHPQCPCSRASLAELDKLMRDIQADAWVLFLKPSETPEAWEKSNLWQMATNIRGVKVMADTDGRLAEAFGAETSGHVLFYDASGQLRYSGGITESRGHEGPNTGSQMIRLAFEKDDGGGVLGKVYGCPLTDKQERP